MFVDEINTQRSRLKLIFEYHEHLAKYKTIFWNNILKNEIDLYGKSPTGDTMTNPRRRTHYDHVTPILDSLYLFGISISHELMITVLKFSVSA